MREYRLLLFAGSAALCAQPACAADALKFGPAPSWVYQQPIPAASDQDPNAPLALLLKDEQIRFDHGKTTAYSEGAFKYQNAQGLSAGNVVIVWQPATDTVTVNKLQIRRGEKIIDVLANGQSFTVLRRETNLDAATLDGTLTATLQPEGLQVGDIIDFATTTERSDPVMKGHAEAMFGAWDGFPIENAHAVISWPSGMAVQVQETPNLPPVHKTTVGGVTSVEMSAHNVQPLIPPNGAPERFKIGRLAEATDFKSWSDLANLFMPLFRDAAVIPASGPLHDEVEKIRSATKNPKIRAEQALALVQDRVRYVALLMGQGGYVPASAETTWSRRFGDCKAKTALLLGVLHSLGIDAEPVIVQAKLGDMVDDRLPMVALFNHVLVRAHIAGKEYWLDGTRTGDTELDSIEVPNFGWGLPLIANAKLVRMLPAPLARPSLERHVMIDAAHGVFSSTAVTVDEIYRGDSAVEYNNLYSAMTEQQRDEAMRSEAKGFFDTFNLSSSSIRFDKDKRELRISIEGSAKLNWRDGWFDIPTSSVGFDPDFERRAGPLHDVPWAINYPSFVKDEAIIRLPPGFAAQQQPSGTVHETLAGTEYARSASINGDILTVDSSERSVAPEISYKDALAAEPRLRAINKDDVYLQFPVHYHATDKDLEALASSTPSSSFEYLLRGVLRVDRWKFDEAIPDFTQVLAQDPKNSIALGERGLAYVWKHNYTAAEEDLAAAEAISPGDGTVASARGLMAEFKGDYSAAVDLFSKALAKNPDDPFDLTHRAVALVDLGQNDEALVDLNKALKAEPKNGLALVNRAMVETNTSQLDSAEADARAALAAAPNYVTAMAVLGSIAERRGNLDQAIQTYSQEIAVETPVHAYDGLRHRAAVFYRMNKIEEAIKDTDQALALGAKSPDLRVLRANIFLSHGKRDLVPAEAEAMIRENPNSNYAFVAAGKTYAALGQREKAMQAFDRAIAIKPAAYVYVNRAQVRPGSDIEGQLADLDHALKLQPNMAEALSIKASILSKQGKYAEALALYGQMPKSATNEQWIETQRAILLAKAGDTADAKKSFLALRSKAKLAGDLNSLCWAEATAGVMLDDALEECREAVKLSNGAAQYLDSLGMALLKLGKLDDALQAYDEAIAKGSGADSFMGRAFVYLQKGEKTHAEADAAAARKISADIEDIFGDYGLKFGDTDQSAKPASSTVK